MKIKCRHCDQWEDENQMWLDWLCQMCWEAHCASEFWKMIGASSEQQVEDSCNG